MNRLAWKKVAEGDVRVRFDQTGGWLSSTFVGAPPVKAGEQLVTTGSRWRVYRRRWRR